MNKDLRKEISKILEHEPYYPVVGGLAECAKCGKQAFEDNETCRINFIIADLLSLISTIEQEAREAKRKKYKHNYYLKNKKAYRERALKWQAKNMRSNQFDFIFLREMKQKKQE